MLIIKTYLNTLYKHFIVRQDPFLQQLFLPKVFYPHYVLIRDEYKLHDTSSISEIFLVKEKNIYIKHI